VTDSSNGYDDIAELFMSARDRTIGADVVRAWSARLARGARVLDVGCGFGVPITQVLVDEGFRVHAVDASPSMVRAFSQRLPEVPVECADAADCRMLEDAYHGIVAWGLIFLLPPAMQADVLTRLAAAVEPGGHLLFTAPREVLSWNDALTDRPSWSLGLEAYAALLANRALVVDEHREDAGGNFYYLAHRPR
jgi:2-polyprenyl-3-methyl-5-hydroxy-6-metoxy-1,4-benzoquinol methylase